VDAPTALDFDPQTSQHEGCARLLATAARGYEHAAVHDTVRDEAVG
jgi:hypothetical protein